MNTLDQSPAEAETIARSVELIQQRTTLKPTAAIILGSGLGGLADQVEQPIAIPYEELPALPAPSAHGHAGKLILGTLGGLPVVVFAGRSHLYEGHSVDKAIASVRLAAALGSELCIASNAAGGLNPRFNVGDLVAIDSHINLFYEVLAKSGSKFDALSEMGNVVRASVPLYDRSLIAKCIEISIQLGFQLHRGAYLGTLGPTYETPAEYRAFRTLGGDMVGMSTILEMIAASQLGMKTLAFSVITNVANPDCPTETTHDEVLDVAKVAQKRLLPLVTELLRRLR